MPITAAALPINTPTEIEPLRLQALLRLCHLSSPALPIGAYAWSQGLEYAVQAGWVHDAPTALDWVGGLAGQVIGTLDLPILLRLHGAWCRDDRSAVTHWSERLLAARDTSELRLEDRQLGQALAKLLVTLEIPGASLPLAAAPAAAPPYASMFALAAVRWNISAGDAAAGYLWSWSENQVLAAVKLVPLGQSAGQRLLHALISALPGIVASASAMDDDDIGQSGVRQGIASGRHEQQYTRLFRS